MTAYNMAVQADIHRKMDSPNTQNMLKISKELGIHRTTLYQCHGNL